ncbi:hypothetical protein NC653_035762 [Populus alba x Populus x berolinensis]|uniref:Uncharacterized protein n=1 Tax=Populus alba x Populus x berolinensis TaxID=444605 RepID=A0AAD6LI56_9ROSI|nr:hypothetical protein NC653_035762 [Populus alba x Populus x berolinensis]
MGRPRPKEKNNLVWAGLGPGRQETKPTAEEENKSAGDRAYLAGLETVVCWQGCGGVARGRRLRAALLLFLTMAKNFFLLPSPSLRLQSRNGWSAIDAFGGGGGGEEREAGRFSNFSSSVAALHRLRRILLRQTLDVDGENPARNKKLAEAESASVLPARKPVLAILL